MPGLLGLFKTKKALKHPHTNTTAPTTQAPTVTQSQNVEYERQRKLVSMQRTLEDMKIRIEEVYKKIDQKQALIKNLIRDKKKAEAKRQLMVLKALQDEVAKQENMCIILEKTKIQLEVTSDTSKVIQVFKDAAELQKDAEMHRDYLDDFLMDKKEREEQNVEIGRLLGEIAAGDQEEKDAVDEMYAEMEMEVLDEDMQKINAQPLKGVERANVGRNVVAESGRREDATKIKQSSTLDDLLMQTAGYH